jgi:tetratricopeptide (TPR) repeat protein
VIRPWLELPRSNTQPVWATSGQDRRALQEYAKVETYLSSILATTHPDLRLHARMLYARTKMNLGAFFVGKIVNLANGMEYLDEAQAMFEELENPIMLAQCMYARGVGYFQFYKYEKAATLFEYAAQEFERWDHPYGVAVGRMMLVGTYSSGKINVDKALEAIELARPWIEQSQNGEIQAIFLVNQGLLKQWGMNQPDQALTLYQQAYDLADSLGYSLARLNAQLRIAGFTLYGDDPTKGIELSGQVAELARENGYDKIELGGLYGLAYGLQKRNATKKLSRQPGTICWPRTRSTLQKNTVP